jgi:hypothetical protein
MLIKMQQKTKFGGKKTPLNLINYPHYISRKFFRTMQYSSSMQKAQKQQRLGKLPAATFALP